MFFANFSTLRYFYGIAPPSKKRADFKIYFVVFFVYIFFTGRKYSCKHLHIHNLLAKTLIIENTNFIHKSSLKLFVLTDMFRRTFEILTYTKPIFFIPLRISRIKYGMYNIVPIYKKKLNIYKRASLVVSSLEVQSW